MSEHHIDALTTLDVLDLDGKAVRLATILDGKPTVLVWLRHYG